MMNSIGPSSSRSGSASVCKLLARRGVGRGLGSSADQLSERSTQLVEIAQASREPHLGQAADVAKTVLLNGRLQLRKSDFHGNAAGIGNRHLRGQQSVVRARR